MRITNFFSKLISFVHPFFLKVKQRILLKKKESFFFFLVLIILIINDLYKWSLICFILGIFFLSSPSPNKNPDQVLKEAIESKYKKTILNRTYLRIKYFWKYNFRKSYRKVKWYELIWQVPFIGLISFYNAVSTRYEFISTVFHVRCALLILIFQNPLGWYLEFFFFFPLFYTTFLVLFPPISNNLKKNYGKNTLKKLGFNTFSKIGLTQGGKFVRVVAGVTASVAGYEITNFYIEEHIIKTQIENQNRIFYQRLEIYNNHPELQIQKPLPPSNEDIKEIAKRVHDNRALPTLRTSFSLITFPGDENNV